jgi:hypothetical protein
MVPTFEVDAAWIAAFVEVAAPIPVIDRFGRSWPDDVAFAATAELVLVARAAQRAFDKQHGLAP